MASLKIIDLLRQKAKDAVSKLSKEALLIRGVTRTSYILRLSEEEIVFHLHYVIVQTSGQGCCYYEAAIDEVGLSSDDLGKDALNIAKGKGPVAIAALDAVFSSLKGKPFKQYDLKGTNMHKAQKRARIVCGEALALLENRSPKNGRHYTVANIGVVGSILAELSKNRILKSTASDFYIGVAGRTVHGVKVEFGNSTLQLIADADVAIVTGMTLANDTLDGILEAALKHNTGLVVFAETGANFASEYCRIGIDSVISEPFPFYLTCHGPTNIEVYRRTA